MFDVIDHSSGTIWYRHE